MNDMTHVVGIGHNAGPATIADVLAEKYSDDIRALNEAVGVAQKAPARIDDDEVSGQAAELIKKMRTIELRIEKHRDLEMEMPKRIVEETRGFFTKTLELSEKLRKSLNAINTDYLDRKKAAEKRRLEEEAARRREEEEAARRRQQAAADTKRDAEFALQEMNRMAQEAAEARSSATTDQELAAAVLSEARAQLSTVKAGVAGKVAEFARREAAGEAIAASEKETSKAAFTEALNKSREAVSLAEDALRQARQRAKEAKEEEQRREEEARAKAREVTAAARDEREHTETADRHAKVAGKIEAKVDGPDADLARTRSLHGAVGTLQRRWTSRVEDKTKLDKEALWPFVNEDAISAALWKWMQTQPPEKRVMAGAIMQIETEGQVR